MLRRILLLNERVHKAKNLTRTFPAIAEQVPSLLLPLHDFLVSKSRKLAHPLFVLSRFDITTQTVLNCSLTSVRFFPAGACPAAMAFCFFSEGFPHA
jgi:hypothetical protein